MQAPCITYALYTKSVIRDKNGSIILKDTPIPLLRFPAFTKADPQVWIIQVRMFFDLAGVMDDQDRFDFIVANADLAVLPYISDIIKRPPEKNKFNTILARIQMLFPETDILSGFETMKLQENNGVSSDYPMFYTPPSPKQTEFILDKSVEPESAQNDDTVLQENRKPLQATNNRLLGANNQKNVFARPAPKKSPMNSPKAAALSPRTANLPPKKRNAGGKVAPSPKKHESPNKPGMVADNGFTSPSPPTKQKVSNLMSNRGKSASPRE